jgi:hypothetical protein
LSCVYTNDNGNGNVNGNGYGNGNGNVNGNGGLGFEDVKRVVEIVASGEETDEFDDCFQLG